MSIVLKCPRQVDGADVIYFGYFDKNKAFYVDEHGVTTPLNLFAIASYDDKIFYLFYCEDDWTVKSDSDYSATEEALEYVQSSFGPSAIFKIE